MLSIRNLADMARALASPLDPELRRLLALRRDQTGVQDVHLIVVRPGDTLAQVEAEAGVSIYLEDDVPAFEWVERHRGWIEAVIVLNDDGFTVALFVPDRIDVDPELLLPLCA